MARRTEIERANASTENAATASANDSGNKTSSQLNPRPKRAAALKKTSYNLDYSNEDEEQEEQADLAQAPKAAKKLKLNPKPSSKTKQEPEEEKEESDLLAEYGAMHLHYSRHYELHCQGDPDLAPEEDQCHWCQIRKFSTHKRAPIYIINKVDNAALPKNFRFIETSVYLEGVKLAPEEFYAGCECEDSGQCRRAGCSCLGEMMVPEGSDPNPKLYVYHSYGSKKGILRSASIDSRDAIYECHDSCKCTLECPNRVVGRGRTIPLQIFRTSDNRGWGVRSTVDIKRGQFVDKYIGEVMTAYQANYRRAKSQLAQKKDVYLFALDKFSNDNSPDERLRGPPLEVDGEFMAGPTRFMNHSCEPILRIFARVGDHSNKHVHDLAFFAIKDIPAGTELTFDYVDGGDEEDNHNDIKAAHKDMTKCLCGSKKCRGYLW